MFKNHELDVPIQKKCVGEHQNLHKRRFDNDEESNENKHTKRYKVKATHESVKHTSPVEPHSLKPATKSAVGNKIHDNLFQNDEKKQNSDKKRQESIKKKRQEFNEKKNIIKTALASIVSCEKMLVAFF